MSRRTSDQPRLQFILCGASGSGKTTMAHILHEQLGLVRCVTHTTRAPRPGELDGIDYHFRDTLDPSEMFECAPYGKNQDQYGASWANLAQSDFIILEPQGVEYYRNHYPGDLCVIQLSRENINVDPERRARDKDAGYDRIHPDYLVTGETIEEMSRHLIEVVTNHLNQKNNTRRPPDMYDMNNGPFLIDSIETLCDVITKCANLAMEQTAMYTTSQAVNDANALTYSFTPFSFRKIIHEDDFEKYFPLIVQELSKREEISDLEVKGNKIEVTLKKEYCHDYDPFPRGQEDRKDVVRALSIAEKSRRYEISQTLDETCKDMPSLQYDPTVDYEYEISSRSFDLKVLSNKHGQPLEGYTWETDWQKAACAKYFGVDRWVSPPEGFRTHIGEISAADSLKYPVVIFAKDFSLGHLNCQYEPGVNPFHDDVHFMNAVVGMTDAQLSHNLIGNCFSRFYPAEHEDHSAELVFVLPANLSLMQLQSSISMIERCMSDRHLPLNRPDWCKEQFEAARNLLCADYWGEYFHEFPKAVYDAHIPAMAGNLCCNLLEFNGLSKNLIDSDKSNSHYEADQLYQDLTAKLKTAVTIETYAKAGDPIARTLPTGLQTTHFQLPYGALEDILIRDAKPGETPQRVENFLSAYPIEQADEIRSAYEQQYNTPKRDLNDILRDAGYNKGKNTSAKEILNRQTDPEKEL